MTTNVNQVQNATVSFAGQPQAANGLALVRLTIGTMFVWVFFENLGKGLYSPAGYAGLINYYIKSSHSPAAWKWIMGLLASHAALAAPMQAMTEISLGILLVIGPAAPLVPVVVMSESACEYRSSFLLITKRRPLAMCLPICLPISSRRSSLSTAIRLTERPISRERWGHKSSRNLAEDTGALA